MRRSGGDLGRRTRGDKGMTDGGAGENGEKKGMTGYRMGGEEA